MFNLPDDGLLELDNPVGMSIAVLGGTTYLFVVGADDDGLSVFSVAANGALTNVANVTDAGDFELDRPIGVTTVVVNGQIHVIVASNFDDGVSTFIFDDGINEQPTLTATGHNPTFAEGGAAVDLFGAPVASTVEPGQSFTSLILTVTNVTDGANEILSFLGNDIALTNGNVGRGRDRQPRRHDRDGDLPGARRRRRAAGTDRQPRLPQHQPEPDRRRPRDHHHQPHRLRAERRTAATTPRR